MAGLATRMPRQPGGPTRPAQSSLTQSWRFTLDERQRVDHPWKCAKNMLGGLKGWRFRVHPIYHITHLKNLADIMAVGQLWCDSKMAAQNRACVGIAHQHIKERRARKAIKIPPGGFVADYVPFYFAPRSPMLYAIHQGKVAGYEGGQAKVVYLVSSVERVLADGYSYCFTDGHAEMGLTIPYNDWQTDKDKVPWSVMTSRYWNDTPAQPDRKRQRQAEFLVRDVFPWGAIEVIGVYDEDVRQAVLKMLAGAAAPRVTVQRAWYY